MRCAQTKSAKEPLSVMAELHLLVTKEEAPEVGSGGWSCAAAAAAAAAAALMLLLHL
jgi:hypothetical protein